MDIVEKNRELVAWVALGSATLLLLGGLVNIIHINNTFSSGDFGDVASLTAGSLLSPEALIAASLATWLTSWWRTPTNNAKVIALIGLIVAATSTVLYLLFALIGLGGAEDLGILVSLLRLIGFAALGAVATGFFYATWKKLAPAPAGQVAQYPGGQQQVQPYPGQQYPAQQYPAQQYPPQQPTWQPDQASGGAWQRAGDAATGASASTWGVPGQQSQGWAPPQSSWSPEPGDDGEGTVLRPK
ncbi:hypothetical protein ACQB6R_10350 [Propionibacteriaceae bacterium G1746]|uniref:hypothetical protein n=1 Tax=Aestuariimicrobium sp. G57 TaxID=3418485 RepID=UPI003C1E91C6